jgi:hypothetical protein
MDRYKKTIIKGIYLSRRFRKEFKCKDKLMAFFCTNDLMSFEIEAIESISDFMHYRIDDVSFLLLIDEQQKSEILSLWSGGNIELMKFTNAIIGENHISINTLNKRQANIIIQKLKDIYG